MAVAIFSSGAIVFWLGGKNWKGGGLANPSSLSKPIQSAQLLGHADLQEDALSPPPLAHKTNAQQDEEYMHIFWVDLCVYMGAGPVPFHCLKMSVLCSRLELFSL